MGWGSHHGVWFFPFLFFPFGMFIVCALFFVVIRVLFFGRFRKSFRANCGMQQGRWHDHHDPEIILKRRLASGDIQEEEYQRLRVILKS
ncbi:hypothetical protein JI721_02780 [Alicyclobacillus cycloheptanicus]|uniref:Membrane protein n=1 Tax=Alicyclobacillus cycloheptanicus TaxID=1457 RepID=A0ABT9XKU5_9BACL|nr:SHOCT domain-containing protein [Alicyclobacillus cycloheptanicus]MDQ0190905.1 putative membrane protein [Alicyclobacillus cycloheptanicus]WDM01790.1 hypothetical protein JI721_02780 [Alicyclobacillus cycloheptanicus]